MVNRHPVENSLDPKALLAHVPVVGFSGAEATKGFISADDVKKTPHFPRKTGITRNALPTDGGTGRNAGGIVSRVVILLRFCGQTGSVAPFIR
jgi:hypothetical protein